MGISKNSNSTWLNTCPKGRETGMNTEISKTSIEVKEVEEVDINKEAETKATEAEAKEEAGKAKEEATETTTKKKTKIPIDTTPQATL